MMRCRCPGCGHTFDAEPQGGHRVMCGDSTIAADVAKLMAGTRSTLVHADPPYGMGKEIDGVENDNLTGAKLDAFQMAWWRAFRPHLESNASAYVWGSADSLWRWWWRELADSEPLTARNEIVWDKIAIPGMMSPDLTQYPEASERCLFFQLGRHVFLVGQTKADYWPGWEPIRLSIVAEFKKAGWTAKRVGEIVGNHMHGHWAGTSQWAMIDRANYDKLQAAADGRAFVEAYDKLHARYREAYAIFKGDVRDPRRQVFDAGRPYFNNAHESMYDVWKFPRVTGDERHGHATPKPVAMVERVLQSSSRPGAVVVEPFIGSGSTLVAAERTQRRCYGVELKPEYVDVAVRRWQEFTGLPALRADGITFDAATLEAKP